MNEELETILARVASGEISASEAEPLVAAAVAASDPGGAQADPMRAGTGADEDWSADPEADPLAAATGSAMDAPPRRNVRLQVRERGRSTVDLRIPIGLAGLAGAMVPGLSGPQAERIREALRSGRVGPVLEVVDERGDGVVISTE